MRIERINENSIRCILTSFDLSVRNLNIRELAYGTEKARKLFNEMMTKASNEVGFEAENTPIMIEAIPMGGDSIQLVITKVDDPEELDTRFSRFSQSPASRKGAEDWLRKLTTELLEGADGLLSQIQKANAQNQQTKEPANSGEQKAAENTGESAAVEAPAEPAFRAFAFETLDRVLEAVKATPNFPGYSTLYKRTDRDPIYVLVLKRGDTKLEDFAKTCNIIAEYGRKLKTGPATLAYFEEHYQCICADRAVQKLASI